MMRRVKTPAQATVEYCGKETGGAESYWEVTVKTAPFWKGKPQQRVYTIKAFTDSIAAEEGLRRFCDEMDPLLFPRVLH
jgi:hypothetical protein